ncbi:MAG: PD40 domain-containing protein [Blastocatellia bacterium]|jgi:hypothetical protein|nr:PD40 domain-containing protein [Blastocatellia bacterium]MBK6428780.1 PD40 domain-containing protein [Blastocatellia bacterium]
MRTTITAALLVTVISFSASAQGNATASPRPIGKRPVAGAVVATIDGGDFVYPRFSPDGKKLAYVSVQVVEGAELDEVILFDIASQKKRKLIDVGEAKKYATYSAYVSSMEWTGRNRLRVSMSDGDVDSEQLTFNTISGRIVRRRHTSEDDTRDRSAAVWMTPAQLLARRKAIAAFGADIADPLDSSLLTSGFLTRDGRIVGMALGPSSSGNVWLLDSVARTRTALLPRPGFPWSASLLGGVEIGRELLLVTSVDRNAWFVRMSPAGKPEELGMVEAVGDDREARVMRVSGSRFAVLVRRHRGAERGSNVVVFGAGSSLVESADYPEVADADVDPGMRNIAFAVWTKDDKRHIVIRCLPIRTRMPSFATGHSSLKLRRQ